MESMANGQYLAKSVEIALRSVSGYGQERVSISAAGITYFALISFFPMALVGLSVASFFFTSEADQQRLIDTLMEQFPLDESGGREELQGVLTSVIDARGTLGVIGLISALYTGSALFTAVRIALNGIFHGEKRRPFVQGKLIDIGMVSLLGTLLLLSTATSFFLTIFGRLADDIIGPDALWLTRAAITLSTVLVPPLIAAIVFFLLYARVPAVNVSWRQALPGVAFAVVVFEILKVGFGIYTANFGNYDATYGSLGFVVLVLAFVYFAAQVTLIGALVARSTAEVSEQWPLADEESRLVAARGTLAALRKKAARWSGRAADEEPHLPVAVADGQGVTIRALDPFDPPVVADAERASSTGRVTARPTAIGWAGAAALLGAVMVAAFARSRRPTPSRRRP